MCQPAIDGSQDASVLVSRTYRVDEIAELLGIGRKTAYNLVKRGHFKTVRIGKTIRISKKSFDMWLDEQHE